MEAELEYDMIIDVSVEQFKFFRLYFADVQHLLILWWKHLNAVFLLLRLGVELLQLVQVSHA